MAVYGITLYGTETYGYFVPPIYRVDPFTAVPTDYNTITVTWAKPSGTIHGYRLIKNMYGAPVDQDDGEILLDVTSGWLGNSFVDTNIVPGAYHYYGFYVLVNSVTDEWVRAALTGCLMITNYGSANAMFELIPSFFVDSINAQNELVVDPIGNTFLSKFMDVIGWGFDYLRTQYDTYQNVNDPWKVPLNDLYKMAGQFNIDINPDIHPHTLRKAIYYNATVNQLRGTPEGIGLEIDALTGWNANITVGQNMMLSNDQSFFADPFFEPWSAFITYNVGEYVQYGNFWYICIATGNYGNAPTGTSSSNTWWQAVLNVQTQAFLGNDATNNVDTWEAVYPDNTNGVSTAGLITTPPTFVALYQPSNAWDSTASPKTVAVNLNANDGLVILGGSSDYLPELNNPTGGTLTYSQLTNIQSFHYSAAYAWETGTDSPTSFNLSVSSQNASTYSDWGFAATQWSNGVGVGNYQWERTSSSSNGEISFTTFGNHSAVVVMILDWNGVDGTSHTWTTVNGVTPTAINGYELVFDNNAASTAYTVYMAYYPDAGTAGTNTYGLSAPTTMKCSIIAVEIQGNTGSAGNFYIYEDLGIADPLNTSDKAFNGVGTANLEGISQNVYLRSISRTTTDLQTTTTTFAPDKYQAMADGIPIPYSTFKEVWSPTIAYDPQDIVTYNNQPFVALRSSLNSTPPYGTIGLASQDWAPLSYDQRFRICISGYETASSGVAVYPFVEWYDAGGNYISRVLSRNPTPGTVAAPNQLAYDSFTVGAGNTLASRTTNAGGYTWTQNLGSWSVSPYGTGCTYPTTTGQRSIATVNTGNANAQVGLTFVTNPQGGQSTGLVLRYLDANNYLRAGMTKLIQVSGGTHTTLGTYSTACNPGDRLLVTLNGSTITCFTNNVQVLQVTSTFNQSQTIFGIINETT